MTTRFEHLRLAMRDGVATLTLDRPPVNALNTAMYKALIDAIAALEKDRSVRVIVLQAALIMLIHVGSRLFQADAILVNLGELPARRGIKLQG